MLVEDLFEQEAGFPQTWGPQEGLVDFVAGVPLVVAADDAAFRAEAAAAQRYDLAGAAFMPHLIAKKTTLALPAEPQDEPQDEQPTEDQAEPAVVGFQPTVDVSFAGSALLAGSDFALDFSGLDEQPPTLPAGDADEFLTGDSSSRDEQRKQRNRESAARSRKRTREKMAYLENLVDHLMKKNRRLELAVQQLSGAAAAAQHQQQQRVAPVYVAASQPSAAVLRPAVSPEDLYQLTC